MASTENATPAADAGAVDYRWSDGEAPITAAYLSAPVLALLAATGAREVLDLGCGNGHFSAELARAGYRVTGCDGSETGIAAARAAVPRVPFFLQRADDPLPVPQRARYDAVVCLEVIEHLLLPRNLLRLARSALVPGGTLVISTPYHGYLKNLALAATNRFDFHFTALWDHGHVKFFSPRTLGAMLAECGFETLKWRGVGRVPYLWKTMVFVARARPPDAPRAGAG